MNFCKRPIQNWADNQTNEPLTNRQTYRHDFYSSTEHAIILRENLTFLWQQREHSEKIRQNMIELDNWKQRSEMLLYSMMPRHIANRLKQGEDPINTCEVRR